MFFFSRDPAKKALKERIARCRPVIKSAGGSLVAWGPGLVVQYQDEASKANLIGLLSPLGWRYTPDPADDEAMLLSFTDASVVQH